MPYIWASLGPNGLKLTMSISHYFQFRAVMGKSICTYQVVRQSDPKLQNAESVSKCVQLLAFLRLVTQVILPKEALCWLIYNGTQETCTYGSVQGCSNSIALTQWSYCSLELSHRYKLTQWLTFCRHPASVD